MTELLTFAEAAEHLRVSVRSVYRYQEAGLAVVKLPGRERRIRRSDLEMFIASHVCTSHPTVTDISKRRRRAAMQEPAWTPGEGQVRLVARAPKR